MYSKIDCSLEFRIKIGLHHRTGCNLILQVRGENLSESTRVLWISHYGTEPQLLLDVSTELRFQWWPTFCESSAHDLCWTGAQGNSVSCRLISRRRPIEQLMSIFFLFIFLMQFKFSFNGSNNVIMH